MKGTWEELKLRYFTTETTWRGLSREFEVPLTSLRRVAQREHWEEQKAEYWADVEQTSLNTIKQCNVDKLSALSRAADTFAGMVEREVNKLATAAEEDPLKVLNTTSIKDLAAAIKTMVTVIRDLNDMPNASETEARMIARRRLEIEEKKLAAEDNSNEFEFVIADDLEDYTV